MARTRWTMWLAPATVCLLAACGRVGEAPRTANPAADRVAATQPAAVAPAPAAKGAESTRAAMPSPESLTDSAITGRIQHALKGDPAMSGADVSINTDRGVVVLSRTVKTHEQTGIASAHAQRQDGVMRVDNHLRPEFS